jgi:valyl-tRNA synthetase
VEQLEAAGQLAKVAPHRHSIRHCYRCDTVVEPRLSDQWFVRMRPLAERALAAYRAGEVRFVPERWGAVFEHWLTEIRDWNISRQLWWGHRIPAWYCDADGCGHITVAEAAPAACERCAGPVRQDEDVLDTWFSSWLWPFATLGWPMDRRSARFYPNGPGDRARSLTWGRADGHSGLSLVGDVPFGTPRSGSCATPTDARCRSRSATSSTRWR